MPEKEEKKTEEVIAPPNDSSVTAENYASIFADAKKKMDAKVEELERQNLELTRQLSHDALNGVVPPGESQAELIKPWNEMYKEYKANKSVANLEFWKRQIELRKSTMAEQKGKDPWVTGMFGLTKDGEKADIDPQEIEVMAYLAEEIERIIEESDGDPAMFNVKFNNLINK